jgi:hypothetical protein
MMRIVAVEELSLKKNAFFVFVGICRVRERVRIGRAISSYSHSFSYPTFGITDSEDSGSFGPLQIFRDPHLKS